jgi:hypothetical protein
MHRIVVIPLPAPDESMLFECVDDLLGHAVMIDDFAGVRPPVPIIREREIKIDNDAVAVRAWLASAGNGVCGDEKNLRLVIGGV